MQKTIFEKIIDREIPATITYEDDICIGILDIKPVRPGHTLLISKKPYPWIQDVTPEDLHHMMDKVQEIIKRMKSEGADYVKVSVVGVDVPHFHIHLIPEKSSNN
jgi:histidine triad (HIT) family protein